MELDGLSDTMREERSQIDYDRFLDCVNDLFSSHPLTDIAEVCNSCGKSYNTVRQRTNRNPEFKRQWEEALQNRKELRDDKITSTHAQSVNHLLNGRTLVKYEVTMKRVKDEDGKPMFREDGKPYYEGEQCVMQSIMVDPSEKVSIAMIQQFSNQPKFSQETIEDDGVRSTTFMVVTPTEHEQLMKNKGIDV